MRLESVSREDPNRPFVLEFMHVPAFAAVFIFTGVFIFVLMVVLVAPDLRKDSIEETLPDLLGDSDNIEVIEGSL